jgi:hypothetical protein
MTFPIAWTRASSWFRTACQSKEDPHGVDALDRSPVGLFHPALPGGCYNRQGNPPWQDTLRFLSCCLFTWESWSETLPYLQRMTHLLLSACVLSGCVIRAGEAHGQSLTTASRAGDLQVGGGFSLAHSDYAGARLDGFTFYSSFDFTRHFGAEVDFHQMNRSGDPFYERSYEMGGRYIPKQYGALTPYAKVMYGRGVLNFPSGFINFYNNIAYNMFVGGGGVEYAVKPWLKVRVDAEYQDWLSGPGLPNGLTPVVGTVGVAYRFGSGRPPGLRWDFPKVAPEKPAPAPKSDLPPKG